MNPPKSTPQSYYPEGDDLQKFIKQRKRGGFTWRTLFQISLIISILSLIALLYNIINGAFGYVAMQNRINPVRLVQQMEENQMLNATNTVSSEDDNDLADGIEGRANAIGFFGNAYLQEHSDRLRAVPVEGVVASAETAERGDYPLTRPLFIYVSADILEKNPAVAAFVNYYLTNVNGMIEEVGYFPISAGSLAEATQTWLEATDQPGSTLPAVDPASLSEADTLSISGSSTVYPLSRQMAVAFRRAGFQGGIEIENVGTTAGLVAFCAGQINIANASRPMTRAEVEECAKRGLKPLEFRVGTDALAIVVSQENTFLDNVTLEQLRTIFTDAVNWSDVNPAWPAAPIERFIPGADSGTLDFFAETAFNRTLADLTSAELIEILETNLSAGLINRYDSEQPLAERSQENLLALVNERVVEQRVVGSWTLVESLFNRAGIEEEVAKIPQGEMVWRNWVNLDFLIIPQSSIPQLAGIRTALLGTLWTILITIVIALPIGVGAAIYLEEYAVMVSNPLLRRLNDIIQTNINNLAGVPSIIYGMLGLVIFVRLLEPLTSGAAFGLADPTTANGRTVLSASLTLTLLVLPLIIINAQEAIRAVPQSLRQAGMGLGATKWQTIWSHVLPNAIPGILTGNILAMSRAIGETAPLVVIGASTFITVDPTNPFSKFTTLPIQIYQWTSRPQDEFRNIAAAAIIVLVILLLTLNATAVLLRNRYSRRLT
jgi:phosphate transport system permease protein